MIPFQIELEGEYADGSLFLGAMRTTQMNKARTSKIELQLTSRRFSVDVSLSLAEALELGHWLVAAAVANKDEEVGRT